MNKLSREAFDATFSQPMREVGEEEEPPFDFWDYVEEIPEKDYEGYYTDEGSVSYAFQDAENRYQHVLLDTDAYDLYMVVVLDLEKVEVHGHFLLDLNDEYGALE